MRRAKRGKDPRDEETVPSFLRPHKAQKKDVLKFSDVEERAEGSQVDVASTVYRPNWGFRKQDSVVGSTKHAMDWSKNSLTSPDYRDFVTNGGIGESEALGCQALATINAHFQGTLHRARSWERKAKAFETESQKKGLHIHQLQEQLKEERERLEAAQAEIVALRADREAEKEKYIDEYFESEEYKKIMDLHDDGLFPAQYTQGWNEAVGAVLERHPGLFEPSDLPSPFAPKVVAAEPTSSEELFGEDDARVKEHAAAVETPSKGAGKGVEEGEESTTQTSPSKEAVGSEGDGEEEVTVVSQQYNNEIVEGGLNTISSILYFNN